MLLLVNSWLFWQLLVDVPPGNSVGKYVKIVLGAEERCNVQASNLEDGYWYKVASTGGVDEGRQVTKQILITTKRFVLDSSTV